MVAVLGRPLMVPQRGSDENTDYRGKVSLGKNHREPTSKSKACGGDNGGEYLPPVKGTVLEISLNNGP